nr:aldehyde dehydrogenase family protein [uncultured Lachnoclostridium sp.]
MKDLPIIRFGKVYESEEKREIINVRHDVNDLISVAIPLVFNTDIKRNRKEVSARLRKRDIHVILDWIKKAGKIFATEDVIINGELQSPKEYCEKVHQVTGLPRTMCIEILNEMRTYMEEMEDILCKQFRVETVSCLNDFYTTFRGTGIGFAPVSDIVCAVMPGNHPIVNMMWIMSFAMKFPVIIKPSFEEPYTPLRLIYSFIQAGADKEFFSYYPIEHSCLKSLVQISGCSILFGASSLKQEYGNDPKVKVYGPGNSKIIIDKKYGEQVDDVVAHIKKAVLYHSGRACISTSAVITEINGEQIARKLGEKFLKFQEMDVEADDAGIAAVRDVEKAYRIAMEIEKLLETGNVIDMTQDSDVVRKYNGKVYLMPKVLYCKDVREPYFGMELPFPFVMVGECNLTEIEQVIGETLSASVLSDDIDVMENILRTAKVEKIYQGYRKSYKMDYGMPHGGFLADFLYKCKGFVIS